VWRGVEREAGGMGWDGDGMGGRGPQFAPSQAKAGREVGCAQWMICLPGAPPAPNGCCTGNRPLGLSSTVCAPFHQRLITSCTLIRTFTVQLSTVVNCCDSRCVVCSPSLRCLLFLSFFLSFLMDRFWGAALVPAPAPAARP